MRKLAFVAAVALAAAFSTHSNVAVAQSAGAANPNQNTENLMKAATNPAAAGNGAAMPAKPAKKAKKKKM